MSSATCKERRSRSALGSLALLILGRRFLPGFPATLLVLALAIVVSALAGLQDHGVDVVGEIPDRTARPGAPRCGIADLGALIAPALGVLILSAEAVGVARALAVKHDYQVDPNRDLVGMGAANALAGLSSGFVQSGGASQTAAADGAGGRSQLASLVAAGLILLTGAFLAPLFEDLPQATLAAIVIVAIAGFFDVAELRRFEHVRRSALVFALLALAGVLALGVLQGLIVTAGLSLVYVVAAPQPAVGRRARPRPRHGRVGPHRPPRGLARRRRASLVVRSDGPLLYPNANAVKERVLALAAAAPDARVVVLDLVQSTELDIQTADALGELADALRDDGRELRLALVRAPALGVLERSGVAAKARVEQALDAALVDAVPDRPPSRSPD